MKPFIFVLSKTGLWTNLDCRSSHEASRSTAADQRPKGLNFLFRKRLCRVDVGIPGPNVPRGKGVDTHAINLGGLRTNMARERLTFAPFACASDRHRVVSR